MGTDDRGPQYARVKSVEIEIDNDDTQEERKEPPPDGPTPSQIAIAFVSLVVVQGGHILFFRLSMKGRECVPP